MIIVGEGIDFTGKTTVLKLLTEELGAFYYSTPPAAFRTLRRKIDQSASNQDHYCFYLRSVQAASAELEVLRDKHQVVVVDRYWPTTLAYHLAMGLPAKLSDFGPIVQPDWIVYFTVSRKVQELRRQERGMTAGDRRGWAHPDPVRQKYDEILADFPNVVRVDTSDIKPEQVVEVVRQAISLVAV